MGNDHARNVVFTLQNPLYGEFLQALKRLVKSTTYKTLRNVGFFNLSLVFYCNLRDNNVMMKMNVILEWTATAVTVLGALATALGYDPLNIYLLNVGSILWLIWAVRVKKLSLVIVNAGLLAVYAYGFVLRML